MALVSSAARAAAVSREQRRREANERENFTRAW
jgi:hypothetical protein